MPALPDETEQTAAQPETERRAAVVLPWRAGWSYSRHVAVAVGRASRRVMPLTGRTREYSRSMALTGLAIVLSQGHYVSVFTNAAFAAKKLRRGAHPVCTRFRSLWQLPSKIRYVKGLAKLSLSQDLCTERSPFRQFDIARMIAATCPSVRYTN